MRIKRLLLYKTNLDADYRNVIDQYSTVDEYIGILSRYPHIEYQTVSNLRSVVENESGFSCILDGLYNDLREYNYACIYTNETYHFYFIVKGNSENDGELPTSRLYFERDAFATHYIDYFVPNIYDKQNFIVTRHIDDWNATDGSSENTITDEQTVPIYKSIHSRDKNVLWAKITTGRELYVGAIGTVGAVPYYGGGAATINGVVRTFYTPFWDRNGAKTANLVTESGNLVFLRTLKTDKGFINGIICDSDEVISIELTWYAPYRTETVGDLLKVYTKEVDDLIPTAGTPVYAGYFRTSYIDTNGDVQLADNTLTYEVTDFLWGSATRSLPLLAEPDDTDDLPSYGYKVLLKPKLPTLSPISFNSIVPFNTWAKYESRLQSYPYKYKSMYYNGEYFDIIPPKGAEFLYIDIDYRNLPSPEFKSWYDNKSNDVIRRKISNNGEMQFVADSKEYYLRNNGASLNAKVTNGLLGFTGKNPMTYIMDNLRNTIDVSASIRDADISRDHYTLPDINALNDIHYQDDLIFMDCEPNDEYMFERAASKIRYKGVNLNSYGDISYNSHIHYDYVQTENCSLQFIPNLRDREVLERAFNNGVYKWHANNTVSGERNTSNYLYMNKDILNLSNSAYIYYN